MISRVADHVRETIFIKSDLLCILSAVCFTLALANGILWACDGMMDYINSQG